MSEYNLLVVDWDFFFPNPMYGAKMGPDVLLYDWHHSESRWGVDMQWPIVAQGWLRNGLELPMCRDYDGFWDRFNLFREEGEPAPMLYGDSNVWSGLLLPTTFGWEVEAWTKVSLWDAHHDCGYKGTLEEWRAGGEMECDSWMLKHHDLGSELEVIYPRWRSKIDGIESGPLIPVNRRIDDGSNPPTVYDAVYICRSGAWVPAWCDEQFEDFLARYPDYGLPVPGNEWTQPRPDPRPLALAEIEAMNALRE
ncbi:hypothetical protein ACFYP4_02275 [Streptomyces sp. NPDC005551]|uniref:hypothetical protein n=1 Tax=Streptomyces sp. NPDC005551 TaxID=3364725 RepID=UPI00367F4226